MYLYRPSGRYLLGESRSGGMNQDSNKWNKSRPHDANLWVYGNVALPNDAKVVSA